MGQISVNQVRQIVHRHIGSKVLIHANRGRHKYDVAEGVIKETYPSIFLVEVKNEMEDTSQTMSFSYIDVLTKDVRLSLCHE